MEAAVGFYPTKRARPGGMGGADRGDLLDEAGGADVSSGLEFGYPENHPTRNIPAMTPTDEAQLYNSATTADPVLETVASMLPSSGIGMQARKRALRERRAMGAGETSRIAANKEAAQSRLDDDDARDANLASEEADRVETARLEAEAIEKAKAEELEAKIKAKAEAEIAEADAKAKEEAEAARVTTVPETTAAPTSDAAAAEELLG